MNFDRKRDRTGQIKRSGMIRNWAKSYKESLLQIYFKGESITQKSLVCYCLIVCTFLNGCATTTRSTLLGIGTGAAIGAGSGAILSQEDKSQAAVTSALVAGVIGGIAGYFTHKGLEDRDAEVRKETLLNLEKFGVSGFYKYLPGNFQSTPGQAPSSSENLRKANH